MRLSRTTPKRQTTQPVTLPAPLGGENYVDGRAMGPLDCHRAINLIPTENGLGSRPGYQEHVTGLTGAAGDVVGSMLPFRGSLATGANDRLFAVTSSGITDVSASADAPSLALAFGSSANLAGWGVYWSMVSSAGRFLLYTDEENGYHTYTESTDTWAKVTSAVTQEWEGSTLYAVGNQVVASGNVYTCTVAGTSHASVAPSHGSGTASDGTVTWEYTSAQETGAVIGPSLADQQLGYSLDPTNLAAVMVWKKRVFLVEKNSTRAWYLDTNAVYGTATSFDFGPQMKQGGSLVNLYNWSYDGGSGMDTLLVGLGSGGDVVIYRGTDPTSIETFGLNGVWTVSGLVAGRRVATDYGGNLAVVSTTGLVPLRELVAGGEEQAQSSKLTRKISPRYTQQASTYGSYQGWGIYLHPSENCLLLTVPSNGPGQATTQWAMSLATGGWFPWRDLPVVSACTWNGELYFGTADGRVCVQRGGVDDVQRDDSSDYEAIDFSLLTQFKGDALQKRIHLIRPTFLSGTGNPLFETQARFGYNLLDIDAASGTLGSGPDTWDEAEWDSATWGGDYSASQPMRGSAGSGRDVAIAIRGSAISRTVLVGIDVYAESGGLLG